MSALPPARPASPAARAPLEPEPSPRSRAAEPAGAAAAFVAIECDADGAHPAYHTVEAPNQARARELAEAAARSAGRRLVDLVTPAFLQALLDRAASHPADLRQDPA